MLHAIAIRSVQFNHAAVFEAEVTLTCSTCWRPHGSEHLEFQRQSSKASAPSVLDLRLVARPWLGWSHRPVSWWEARIQ